MPAGADYLKTLGTDDDGDFDTLLHSLESSKTFDILMFRGSDFVSDAIARVSKGHGADFFSHVGMVVNTTAVCKRCSSLGRVLTRRYMLQIKAPLLPNGGRYLEGLNDTGELGNLPFISLNLRLLDSPTPGGMLQPTPLDSLRLQTL